MPLDLIFNLWENIIKSHYIRLKTLYSKKYNFKIVKKNIVFYFKF